MPLPKMKAQAKSRSEVHSRLHQKELELQKKSRQLAAANLRLADSNRKLLGRTGELTGKSHEMERTVALLKRELDLAKKSAVAAREAKSHFLVNMSREIRTPMTGMLGMIDFTLDSDLKPDQASRLEIARRAGKALVKVINDVLDFARIEAGHLRLAPEPFDVRRSIADLLKPLGEEAAKKQIRLRHTLSDAVPEFILADEMRIRQILLNLVGNAVKFTQRGSVTVQVHVSQDCDGKNLCLSIADTGVGIPEERRGTIFDAFVQAEPSGTRSHGDTGLGLAISAKLVSLMGGEISCQSSPGAGSTFSVTIPVAVAPEPEAEALTGQVGKPVHFPERRDVPNRRQPLMDV